MNSNTNTTASASTVERGIALTTSATPIVTGILAPLADNNAGLIGILGYGLGAGFLAANYLNKLPPNLLHHLPAGDIIRAHASPMFISTVTTGIALAMGRLGGPDGADALMAGFLELAEKPLPGIISLGWWAAVGLVPFKLRNVLRRTKKSAPTSATVRSAVATMTAVPSDAQQILKQWATHISNPTDGSHKDQVLTVRTLGPHRWTGTITARTGSSVTVTDDNVSSVYKRPAEWIHITPGAHSGEKHIVVNLVKPPGLDTSTLEGAWKKWAARSGGVMAGTTLEDVQTDPNTGGEVAYVVAGEDLDKLPVPDRSSLAGALRTNTLLCSYNPVSGDPRKGEIRLMKHNPLQEGVPFPGTHVLKISEGGYVQIGRHVSGFPARVQFTDPQLGAKHLFVAGVTGSGKGGLVQIVALADHVNFIAIIYGDPKGSSNPDIETMACYSGLVDGVMGSLRIAYALLNWRMEESARLKMKNFVPTPDRPWVRVLIDEAHTPLSEWDQHKKEAGIIIEALASKARSQGIILTLVNQAVNADKLGGSTALRMNVIQGGSLVMLRSDSGQQHLVTTGFEGVDPGDIPASWDVERPLVYDEKVAMKDPKSTFGLGYTLGPGGAAEMMRTFILESAAPYIDENAIAYPADWPDWENRHEIAATSILGDGEDGDSDGGALFGGPIDFSKPETAQDKILKAIEGLTDPIGVEVNYIHRDVIGRMAGLEGASTLDHNLGKLVKAGKIHRQPKTPGGKDVRGWYGLGPAPAPEADSE